jgi:hypothetical protein
LIGFIRQQGVFMRTLNISEVSEVSGGECSVDFEFGPIGVHFSGPETVQDIYGGAVDVMADFFTWWDPNGYYSSGC